MATAFIYSSTLAAAEPAGMTGWGAERLRALAAAAVEQKLAESGVARGARRSEVEAGAIDSRLALGSCATPPTVDVDLSRLSSRLNARVRCAGPSPWSLYIPVTLRIYRDVVVADRALPRGTILSASDLRVEERDSLAANQPVLERIEDAVGQGLRRPLAPNTILGPAALESPVLVRRGERITVSVRSGGISVSTVAEALRDGRKGERIQARNLQSRRTIDLTFTGAGQGEILRNNVAGGPKVLEWVADTPIGHPETR
ncbi:MAG: flagellar basal body P-ring formation chaperone FlgA [Gammaproteobacteria bacterium]